MSDQLVIGGPHSIGVTTSVVFGESLRYRAAEGDLGALAQRLSQLDSVVGHGLITAADAPQSVLTAETALQDAARAIARARNHAEQLTNGLARAASGYEFAEDLARSAATELAARAAWMLGWLSPHLLAVAMPGLLLAGGTAVGVLFTLDEGTRSRVLAGLGVWWRQNDAVLSDPRFVELVRLGVMSSDDFADGIARMPPELAHALGDEGLGVLGVDTSAAVVGIAAGGVGMLRETGVQVIAERGRSHGQSAPLTSPGSVADRVARIPTQPEQIRIDRYSVPGKPDRFEVYLAGTADFGMTATDEPWDMTSNVAALAGDHAPVPAASLRAAEEAMRQAGVTAATPVTITGYSQGGLVAAELAASGNYAVDGLVTFGAPAGPVAVPHDIPYLALEHNNDLVPALGGVFSTSDPVIVRRELSATELAGPAVLPAHERGNYATTARLVDNSTDTRITDLLSRFDHDGETPVTSTLYRAERRPPR